MSSLARFETFQPWEWHQGCGQLGLANETDPGPGDKPECYQQSSVLLSPTKEGEKPPAILTRVRHWEAEAFFWMRTRINLPQLLHEAECGFAQLSQSLHTNFFQPFLGRQSQSHSFRWTNMARHWRDKSQLKINTSSNTLFTFPVSLFIPKYPVGAGARWLARKLLKFSHTYLVAT